MAAGAKSTCKGDRRGKQTEGLLLLLLLFRVVATCLADFSSRQKRLNYD